MLENREPAKVFVLLMLWLYKSLAKGCSVHKEFILDYKVCLVFGKKKKFHWINWNFIINLIPEWNIPLCLTNWFKRDTSDEEKNFSFYLDDTKGWIKKLHPFRKDKQKLLAFGMASGLFFLHDFQGPFQVLF